MHPTGIVPKSVVNTNLWREASTLAWSIFWAKRMLIILSKIGERCWLSAKKERYVRVIVVADDLYNFSCLFCGVRKFSYLGLSLLSIFSTCIGEGVCVSSFENHPNPSFPTQCKRNFSIVFNMHKNIFYMRKKISKIRKAPRNHE